MEIDPNKQHFNGCIRQDDHEPFGECVYEDHPMMPLGTCRPGCTNPASHSKPLDCFVNGLDLGQTEPWRRAGGFTREQEADILRCSSERSKQRCGLAAGHHGEHQTLYMSWSEDGSHMMYRPNEDTHIPYSGKPHRPDYYRPQRKNPRIDPSADASDVTHAWGIDDPRIASAIERLLRAGKKPGESLLKDLHKTMEEIHRAIEYEEMRLREEG